MIHRAKTIILKNFKEKSLHEFPFVNNRTSEIQFNSVEPFFVDVSVSLMKCLHLSVVT